MNLLFVSLLFLASCSTLGKALKPTTPVFIWSSDKGLDIVNLDNMAFVDEIVKTNVVLFFSVNDLNLMDVSIASGAFQDKVCDNEKGFLENIMSGDNYAVSLIHKADITDVRETINKCYDLEGLSSAEKLSDTILGGTRLFSLNLGRRFNSVSDAQMNAAFDRMQKASTGKTVVGILAGRELHLEPEVVIDYAPGKNKKIKFSDLEMLTSSRFLDDNETRGETFISMYPDLFSGLILMLFFFAGLFTFICCIDCAEAPSKLATRQPFKGKEFN